MYLFFIGAVQDHVADIFGLVSQYRSGLPEVRLDAGLQGVKRRLRVEYQLTADNIGHKPGT